MEAGSIAVGHGGREINSYSGSPWNWSSRLKWLLKTNKLMGSFRRKLIFAALTIAGSGDTLSFEAAQNIHCAVEILSERSFISRNGLNASIHLGFHENAPMALIAFGTRAL